MSAQITYPTTVPEFPDTQAISLAKILQATNAGGGGGGSGSVTSGHGAPSGDPGVADAVYYDLDNGDLWQWNDESETWV